jgi:hypothetical protein
MTPLKFGMYQRHFLCANIVNLLRVLLLLFKSCACYNPPLFFLMRAMNMSAIGTFPTPKLLRALAAVCPDRTNVKLPEEGGKEEIIINIFRKNVTPASFKHEITCSLLEKGFRNFKITTGRNSKRLCLKPSSFEEWGMDENREPAKRIQDAYDSNGPTLDLSNFALTDLPEHVKRLAMLQSIDLSGNELTTFPSQISQLPRLKI